MGDEVAWFAEYPVPSATQEFASLQSVVDWQPIVSAGNTRYAKAWVDTAQKLGIAGVWGRCFEQTFADDICDRGCPPGFYYLKPDCYKVPSREQGGLVSVPWVSSDLNLVFRLGWSSGFTFDPNDVLNIGVVRGGNIDYWKRLVAEYRKLTELNAFVPLVIQQEYTSVGDALRKNAPEQLEALDSLLRLVRDEHIRVVTMGEAVRIFRQCCPDRTPPQYALFDNLGASGLAAQPQGEPKTGYRHVLQATTQRLTKASAGAPFNGYYANDFHNGVRTYFSADGRTYHQQGRLFVYSDANGLLMFDEKRATPVRITSYLELPPDAHKPVVLPELSAVYDTDRLIPEADLHVATLPSALELRVKAHYAPNDVIPGSRLPYGVMLWGDYASCRLPSDAPPGARIIGNAGLFVPMVLREGDNEVALKLRRMF